MFQYLSVSKGLLFYNTAFHATTSEPKYAKPLMAWPPTKLSRGGGLSNDVLRTYRMTWTAHKYLWDRELLPPHIGDRSGVSVDLLQGAELPLATVDYTLTGMKPHRTN